MKSPDLDSIREVYAKFCSNWRFQTGHYFRTLYHIFKHIDESEVLTESEKYRYAKIVRAQLSSAEVALLFVNCLSPIGDSFKRYVKKYALLQELTSEDLKIKGLTDGMMQQLLGPESFHDAYEQNCIRTS